MSEQVNVHEAYDAMKRYGGGFMTALAEALIRADKGNAETILKSWNEDIKHLVKLDKGL